MAQVRATYKDKLKDPRWQKRRLEILQRDEFSCAVCYDGESTLHVHHRAYKRGSDPWDVPDSYLVTLCEECHREESLEYAEILKEFNKHWQLVGGFISNFVGCVVDPFRNAAARVAIENARQLDEYDLSVIGFCIDRVLRSAQSRDDFWQSLRNEYFDSISRKRGRKDA